MKFLLSVRSTNEVIALSPEKAARLGRLVNEQHYVRGGQAAASPGLSPVRCKAIHHAVLFAQEKEVA